MPVINDGSRILGLQSTTYNEWIENSPGVQVRRYLGVGRLTTAAQLIIPLFVPARGKGNSDIPLVIGASETVYRVTAVRPSGITIPTSAALKVAVTLADAGAIVTPTAASNYVAAGSTAASGNTRPGGTAIALGAAATQLNLFAVVAGTPTTAAATGALIPASANAADTIDAAIRLSGMSDTDRNLIVVEICTELIASAPTVTATNPNAVRDWVQQAFKGI